MSYIKSELVTVRVTYGVEVVTSQLENNIVQLTIDKPLSSLNVNTASDYTFRGSCDASLGEGVNVIMGNPDTEPINFNCTPNNTFEGVVNASYILSNPAMIKLKHGSQRIEVSLSNELLIAILGFDLLQDLTVDNEEAYLISGYCDFNFGDVTVFIGESVIQETFSCQSGGIFSGSLNVSSIHSHLIILMARQEGVGVVESSPILNKVNRFVTRWEFTEDNYVFTLPLKRDLNYNFIVDWGDGTNTSELRSYSDTDKSHTYDSPGEYIITITGKCEGFLNSRFNGLVGPHSNELLEVIRFGSMGWKDLSFAFSNNSNLEKVHGGDMSLVKDMSYMFDGAAKATPDTHGWDTSKVRNMSFMFRGALSANPDTSGWNTAKVTRMEYMFSGASSARPETSSWNTAQVIRMEHMFSQASSANPDTRDWDTSRVINMTSMFYQATQANPDTRGWNMAQVTSISNMFYEAVNAEPNVLSWETSKVEQMSSVFYRATKANPDISSWDMSQVKDVRHMLTGSNISSENYSNFLISLAGSLPENIASQRKIVFFGNKIKYNSQAVSSRQTLVNNGWSVFDGGLK